MERINQILKHPEFRRVLEEIDRLEADRAFCLSTAWTTCSAWPV